MRSLRFTSILSILVAVATAHGLTLDTSLNMGALTFNDGLGNTGSATIEHISSDAAELAGMYDYFSNQGHTISPVTDLDGTIEALNFGVADYGFFGNNRVLGMTWDLRVGGGSTDMSEYNWALGNQFTSPGTTFFYSFTSEANNPNAPLSVDPTYDSGFLTINSNYGWIVSEPQFVDVRYILFGRRVATTSGDVIELADGVKMTLRATLTPVPEPASMVALGLGAFALVRRRRVSR